MIDNILTRKGVAFKTKVTVKGLVSAGIVALAVVLPMLVHLAFGAEGGVKWLPMYLPVLIGGGILGVRWGLGVGIASPLASFAVTSLIGNPMPAAARLPFMIAELAVLAAVSGLFSKKIVKSGLFAFPATILAFVLCRTVFVLLVLVFNSFTPFSPELIFAQIESGILAVVLQSVTVPFAVIGLKLLLGVGKIND